MAIEQQKSGTGDDLMLFLEMAPLRGLLNEGTAKSYRAAIRQILLVIADGEDPGDVRILDLDVEDALAYFRKERGTKYTEGSLASYETRFRKAVAMYKHFLDDPESLQPAPQRRLARRDQLVATAAKERTVADWVASQAGRVAKAATMIDYPFPLTTGGTAHLHLPRELHPVDVARLTKFLESIAMPDRQGQLQLSDPRE